MRYTLDIAKPDDEAWVACRQFEVGVFSDSYGRAAVAELNHLRQFDRCSIYLLVRHSRSEEIVGCARLVLNGDGALPTFNEIARTEVWARQFAQSGGSSAHLGPAIDIATLAVSRRRRSSSLVAASLYYMIYRYVMSSGAVGVVAVLNIDVLKSLQRLAIPIRPIEGLEPLLQGGAWCVPCDMVVDEITSSIRRSPRPIVAATFSGAFLRRGFHLTEEVAGAMSSHRTSLAEDGLLELAAQPLIRSCSGLAPNK